MALSPLQSAEWALPLSDQVHLRRLTSTWGVLADFAFSDLVLYVPLPDEPDRFVVWGHVRPSTSQTIYHSDLLGEVRTATQRPLVAESLASGAETRGDVDSPWLDDRIRVRCIPVVHDGRVIATMVREYALSTRRGKGQLESAYEQVFERFASMIRQGTFPYPHDHDSLPDAPRVGDGVLVADGIGLVTYASPNANSALTASGIVGKLSGRSLADLQFGHQLVADVLAGRPVAQELESATDTMLSISCLPLLEGRATTGVVVLLRDITDLRRRDRLLVSKDATIREIHHRVKNNLQTISSLLRLQARRLSEPSARDAIEESVRRIRSIALVHETLSREAGDDVNFSDVVRPLVRMVEEGLVSPDRPVSIEITGDGGTVASPTATSLAVVLTELLQNVMEHAYPEELDLGDRPAIVVVHLDNDGSMLEVTVTDDGLGMPEGFDPSTASSLGLSIVTTLVRGEMAGTIGFRPGGGVPPRTGTVVELRVPLAGRSAAGV